jgi:hypothetical protein
MTKLDAPIEIAKFWKNRAGEAVIVQLREYHDQVLIDARVNYPMPTARCSRRKRALRLLFCDCPT